jgi:outer membrane protein assembly factor BamD (BamD/ComL family)
VQNSPTFFEEAIQFKFDIAERLGNGARKRLFGTKQLPKWAPGRSLAIEIFDEIIAAVPCHDIAAQSLVSKGWLEWRVGRFREAVEAFQQVIRRFPKHELTPECYLMISHVYLDQSAEEYQNSDILTFARLNLQKFKRDFPREERICMAEQDLMGIKETYAKGLYEMGRYYERKYKPRASMIYYNNAIYQFPDTCIAELCRDRMFCLKPDYVDTSRSQAVDDTVEDLELAPGQDLFIDGL